tara:strand:+ start:518 stop:994 length:477 start_codon:yes stop_codon:yes gene_type:complete
VQSVKEYKNKLAHITNNMDEFLLLKTTEHMNKIIIDEIQRRMEVEKFSPKIIQNTYLKAVNVTGESIRAKVVSEYSSESGFDVAVAREKGTKDHMIAPTTKQALSWIFQGIRMFSKGHMVSGLKSLNLVRNTIKDKSEDVKRAVDNDFQNWVKQILNP